ncbi:MAG: Threonine-tRNA ligase [Candidatus Moranbacteria bacterium GW2011_GWF1_44_4]|nr:MAG: Threonine-tRNA ligase [Candidatus Moranbacteria bacterium GW2011_GWF1_44_4]
MMSRETGIFYLEYNPIIYNRMEKTKRIEILRHSLAHVLAAAVYEMFPDAKFGVGPAVENGFYYDFDLPRTLIPEDLDILEEKMFRIIKANHKFEKANLSFSEALKDFKKAKQPYKLELIKDIKRENSKLATVAVFRTGNFVDLCLGPHLESTGEINLRSFKLTKISGAYWKGDEKNKMLQRIYGVAFTTEKELKNYLAMLAEAEKRDHKKIGRDLGLFSFHAESPGSAFWHPKGMTIWNELEQFGKRLRKKYGFQEIQTPLIAKNILWKQSGHWDHYKDSMFSIKSESETYCLKPMDCPFNILMYKERTKSYRDLPIRFSEIGRIMRNEKSGELNGLLRVRYLTQDDSHIFCLPQQVEKEIAGLLRMVKEYYPAFCIEPQFFLSTRPDDYMGKKSEWDLAEKNLSNALKKERVRFGIKEKDGAFYGPKIDIEIKDALGRNWQLATIQLDFQMPQRFGLEYTDEKGKPAIPVMIHAAVFGSFERFIGILTEHYAGAFPFWIAPIQVEVIPVSDKFQKYGTEINSLLSEKNIRSVIHESSESLGKRIRNAQYEKINYMLIVGEKEMKTKTVAVRDREKGDIGAMKIERFLEKARKQIQEKK